MDRKKACGGHALRIAVGMMMLGLLLANGAGAENSYESMSKIPSYVQWHFLWPSAVAVDSSGNVYVADGEYRGIQKFDSSGILLAKWGSSGRGDGQFNWASGIAVDNGGNVYVADWNDRIQKFSSSGTFFSKWGSYGSGDGQFNDPNGVAVDSEGNVYRRSQC